MNAWLVCRHPDPERSGWTTITGRPGEWEVSDAAARKDVMVEEAMAAFVAGGMNFDLTVTDALASKVMADPDAIAGGDFLTVVCPEAAGDRHRWVSVNLDEAGEFVVGRLLAGGDVTIWLSQLTEHFGQERFHREVLQIRPNWSLADLVDEPQQAVKAAFGGAR